MFLLLQCDPPHYEFTPFSFKVEEARQDPELLAMAELLISHGGPSALAGQRLRVVLAGAEAATITTAVESGNAADGIMALDDLRAGPGGRHSNDHVDFRYGNQRDSCI